MIKLFDAVISQIEDVLIEDTSKGDLLISTNGDGTFIGENLKGKILPIGFSTTYTPSEGLNIIKSLNLMETDDGTKIFMKMNANLHLPQELENKILAGNEVSPDEYYYKGTVNFDVGGSKYKWLENKLFICDVTIDSWKSLKLTVFEV